MDNDDTPFVEPRQERRNEGPLHLRAWATQEQLGLGLATAREIFAARGVTPGRAGVRVMAVSMFADDPSLPEPDANVRAAAAAFEEAADGAILAAGGRLNEDNEMSCEQSPEDRLFWNTQPTLRAWRIKTNSPNLDKE